MKRFTWLIIYFFATSTLLAQSDEDLKKQLKNTLQQEELIGASWSTINDGMISTGAVGLKNATTGEKLTANNKIQIGSITKTLIATGILRLITENKIDLETPVEQLIPAISFENPWQKTRKVTVIDLLNHTSGLEDARFWQVFSEEAQTNSPLLEVFSRDPDVLTIRTKPGSRFSYSNMGYTLLGSIIEHVTGQPYEVYLDENLLMPLGMKNSTFQFVSQDDDPDLAMGHFDGGVIQPCVPMYLRPAGQFTTTTYDMALLARFLMSDGKIEGKPFIELELLRAMGKPTQTEVNKQGLDRGYQFGLSYRDRYGVIGYYHSGNVIGYRASLYLFPEEKKSFFISFNMDHKTADYQAFNKIFIEHLKVHQPLPSPLSNSQTSLNVKNVEGYYKLAPVRFELFAYLDLLFNSIRIESGKEKEELIIKSLQQKNYSLFKVEKNLYRKDDRVKASHIFYKLDGEYIYSDGLATYKKVSPFYLALLWLSLALGIAGMIIILSKGVFVLIKQKRLFINHAVFVPFLFILLLFVPVPFFFIHSFNQMGDLTIGNLLLTIITGALPFSLLYGIVVSWRNQNGWNIDILIFTLLIQWIIILWVWNIIPIKFWEI
ncbi:serine hydrolase domain-containing protein [Mangrovivirga cuniculi]|uniref:Methicillin resistance protein FmtA n=1 Tax=Mangrovivirga cuniculi TaxID=2715131 RepID=A0A4D7JF34_9BACT|nr:serine hydrolase domain-containing protein [Mangrovivirga cuniculi]QCK14281.1 methicillin resistance protein FmtA [Mangrovivirga cuniculi]